MAIIVVSHEIGAGGPEIGQAWVSGSITDASARI
jgi:hypothetical protein